MNVGNGLEITVCSKTGTLTAQSQIIGVFAQVTVDELESLARFLILQAAAWRADEHAAEHSPTKETQP
ncbi:hypothetical protein W02_38280 [Nitrospira sp. KM1]|uniref:hypothetical protein n=1 Tax=Nitrospira sp. KM1 TaxID=1936990 RepID=UPI0013A75F8A|nr:hypothetical protein [Nitrospira sp. KM1]BCA56688.1 hypothetical protein W02_38280 [Nitrospira sp. KM1]